MCFTRPPWGKTYGEIPTLDETPQRRFRSTSIYRSKLIGSIEVCPNDRSMTEPGHAADARVFACFKGLEAFDP